jgi:AmmeMemoRadiSam system protein B/AmmeMemoRadiSam system protein A
LKAKTPAHIALLITLVMALLAAGTGPAHAEPVRKALRAGSFYPAEPDELRRLIETLTAAAARSPVAIPAGRPLRAIVLPHAGYPYSGPTAAHAGRVLSKGQFATVLLMGPDHYLGLRGAAIPRTEAFETPLGRIPLSRAAGRLLERADLFQALSVESDHEHSLEVVLPFLQYYLMSFDLIPVIVGSSDPAPLAAAVRTVVDERTLIVVSSDLSHFLPYAEAVARDRATISAIIDLNPERLLRDDNRACGAAPLAVLLNLAAGMGWQPVLLNYQNSGDTAGDLSRVVGYAAIAFFGAATMHEPKENETALMPEDGRSLLKLARHTLLKRFGRQPAADPDEGSLEAALCAPSLQRRCGTFVTLKLKGQLRGCIGNLSGSESIVEGVRQNAVNAAFHDPRFSPLTESELERVEIEVSVLSAPAPLAYTDGGDLLCKLKPNRDGVIIRKGYASATFLPQVWEQLPRPEDFLSHLCLKAGLARDAWKTEPLEVSTYQVQYFEEQK